MADLKTTLSLDTGSFDSGISSAIGSVQKLDKQARLASKGFQNFFDGKSTDGMRQAFAGVDQILKKLETSIGSAGSSMKKDLRVMTAAAQELENEYRNLSRAEQQTGAGQALRQHIDELIAKSGSLKDTMIDVQGAINFASSDTASLDALAQGITTLSAGLQVAAGAASLFGVSEEKVAQVQKTLIAIMAVTNGLKTIQNALQKESNLLQFIAIAREKGLAVAMGIKATATTAATVAVGAETAAVEANTAAWAMNPIGAVIVAVLALGAAIVALTSYLTQDTEAEKGEAEAIKSVKQAAEEGYKTYKKNEMELTQLKQRVDSFVGSKKEEKQLVEELNRQYGDALGKYKDLDSWKKALAGTSLYYCRIMQFEAKLAALNAEAYSAWAKAMAGEDYEKNMAKYNALQKPIADALDDLMFYQRQLKIARNLAGDISVQESNKSGSGSGKTKTTSSADNKTEREKLSDDISKLQKQLDSIDKQKYPEKAANIVSQIVSKYREVIKFLNTSTEEGANEQINTLKKIRSYYAVSSEDYKRLTTEIRKAQENLYVAEGIQGGAEVAIKRRRSEIAAELSKLDPNKEGNLELIARLKLEDSDLQFQLNDIRKKLESPLDIIGDLPKLDFDKSYKQSNLEKLQSQYDKATESLQDLVDKQKEATSATEWNELSQKISDTKAEIISLRKAINTQEIIDDIKEYNKNLKDLRINLVETGVSGIRGLYDSFTGISEKLENAKNSFDGFLIVVEEFVSVFDNIKSIIDIINQISEATKLLTGATQAATIAKQTENTTTEKGATESLINASAKETEAAAAASAAGATGGKAAAEAMEQNSKMGPFGWIAGIAAAIAVLAMLGTIMGSFANGGIIGGNSYHGDRLYARVNSGEMILNQKQQANLFRLLDSGVTGSSGAGNVEFKIRGQELVGVLNNFNNKHNRLK